MLRQLSPGILGGLDLCFYWPFLCERRLCRLDAVYIRDVQVVWGKNGTGRIEVDDKIEKNKQDTDSSQASLYELGITVQFTAACFYLRSI